MKVFHLLCQLTYMGSILQLRNYTRLRIMPSSWSTCGRIWGQLLVQWLDRKHSTGRLANAQWRLHRTSTIQCMNLSCLHLLELLSDFLLERWTGRSPVSSRVVSYMVAYDLTLEKVQSHSMCSRMRFLRKMVLQLRYYFKYVFLIVRMRTIFR